MIVSGRKLAIAILTIAVGCSDPMETAEVDGVLSIRGAPGHKVFIQFIPDVDKGAKGPMSMAETDADGRFKLQFINQGDVTPQEGAVVGWHRIVLSDQQLAESATGRGVPIRFAAEYGLPGSTPLVQEIMKGKQSVRIEIP
jgi:hypothetical protein